VKTILTLMALGLLVPSVMGQIAGDPPHTIDVIEATVRDLADTMLARCEIVQGARLPVRVLQHPDAAWIQSLVLRRLQERGIETAVADFDERLGLTIVIEDASTRYLATPDRDSVERSVVVKLSSTCQGRTTALPIKSHRVTMTRQNVDAFQSQQHRAAHGELPQADGSLWDDVVEPLIYVAAAAVTVVLFFTVRTQ